MEKKISTVTLMGRDVSVHHNDLQHGRAALLFLHGLGDSAHAFDEAFDVPGLAPYNVLVPDMPGYGNSSRAGEIGFDEYIALLSTLMNEHGCRSVLIVCHSMGGAIGTLAGQEDMDGRVRGLVNVEGNLTVADQFISRKALEADQAGRFDEWYHRDFLERTVARRWAPASAASQRYLESLRRCDPQAFLSNCHELVRRSSPSPNHALGEVAEVYLSLTMPKLFCAGEKSCPAEILELLEKHREKVRVFPKASHAVMIDAAAVFYAELSDMARRLLA